MFHEPNLRAYPGGNGNSLLGDLIDATLAKYANLVTVPITSPTQDVLGQKQASRIAYDAALKSGAVSASIVPNTSVQLTAASGLTGTVTVPVTGAKGTTITWGASAGTASKEQYAGQPITYVTLAAGQSVTVSLSLDPRASSSPGAMSRRSGHDVTGRQALGSQPVRVRSGETPGSPVAKPPGPVERPGSKRGGATGRSAA